MVPVYLRFGDKVYRDRVDISEDEFYQKLVELFLPPLIGYSIPEA